jgi:hypothetical protein
MMRVYFLTLPADNLPETGNRQYENKADLRASRRNGVDRRTTQKHLCHHFFRRTKCGPMRCNIGKRLKMIELARQRTDRQGAPGGISNSGICGVPEQSSYRASRP